MKNKMFGKVFNTVHGPEYITLHVFKYFYSIGNPAKNVQYSNDLNVINSEYVLEEPGYALNTKIKVFLFLILFQFSEISLTGKSN